MDELVAGPQTDLAADSLAGSTGAVGYLFGKTATQVSDLFSNPIEIAEGSSIEVIEELYLELEVVDESLIDKDLRWFGTKEYLGTYRIYRESQALSTYVDPDNEGFITNRNFYLKRTSRYLVVGDFLGRTKDFGSLALDKCTFALIPQGIVPSPPFPPVGVDGLVPQNPVALFRGTVAGNYYPLGQGVLEYEISSIGLYLRKGVQFSTGRRETRIGGQVRSVRPLFERTDECGTLTDQCATREAEFFNSGLVVSRTYAEMLAIAIASEESAPGNQGVVSRIVLSTQDLGGGCLVEYYRIDGDET